MKLEQSISSSYMNLSPRAQVSRCLIANDDPFILFTASQTLSRHFGMIDKLENGRLAYEKVSTNEPHYY